MSRTGLDLRPVRAKGTAPRVPQTSEPAPAPEPATLWLCLHLSRLALEVHARLVREARPLAIIDGEDRLQRVVVCDERAAALGVRSGLGLNTALALAPALGTVLRSTRREQAALLRLAAWAGQLTPRVSLAPPDELLLEVRGSLALFGGAEQLRRRVEEGLAALGYRAQLALAPTPLAAQWLARAGIAQEATAAHALPGCLAGVPLACLRWPEAVHESLRGMGVRVVGDCLRLPRDGFARRFGVARLADLDRALGRRPDPRADYTPPARFTTQIELPIAMQAREPLCHALALLLEELCGFLRARDGGVREVRLGFVHHAAPVTRVDLALTQPSRSAAHWLDLLTTRLERVVLPEPVLALRLRSGAVLSVAPPAADLLGSRARVLTEGPQLIERLRARLGSDAVHGLGVRAEHRPEAAWLVAEPGTVSASAENRARPLWLLAEPRPLDLVDGRPCLEGRLDLLRGPERIESGWWDGADVTRDYYVACNPQGMRLWIYRTRGDAPAWYLQGIFA
jgi:protein ImuB